MDNLERELGWDDTIQKESEFVLLPEGEYNFQVESFERGRTNGGGALPPCNMAILKIRLFGGHGESTIITHNLVMHTKTEWMLSAFFTSIGQKKKGEPLKMNWNQVYGAKGRCNVGIKQYNGNEYNEIKKFLPPEDKPAFVPGEF